MHEWKQKVRLTFTEELLGTASADPEIFQRFIASKNPTGEAEDESKALPPEDELHLGTTVFPRTKAGTPFVWDYQVKGFFKDACGMMRRSPGSESSKTKAYKKEIDGLIFIEERQIPLVLPEGQQVGFCERPLRAATAQGERIALARSETCPAGSQITFTIRTLFECSKLLQEWLEYGALRGLGQWRNSGRGRFSYELL